MSASRSTGGDSDQRGVRLQKFLSHAGVASRRASEELIRAGEVTINGRLAELGDRVGPSDAVKVGNKLVQRPDAERLVLALNKPEGTMTTTSDPEGRSTVFDLIPARLRTGLFAVGRLDYGTEGLLLLTNDGDLAQRVTHPRYGCTKRYRVKVRGEPDERSLDRLRRGLVLDGRRLQPATIEPHRLAITGKQRRAQKNTWWTVEIGEGRTRQVRKMFERIGHPVSRLQRVSVGPIQLGRLAKGEIRELDEAEIAALERATRQTSSRPKPGSRKQAAGSRPGASGAGRGGSKSSTKGGRTEGARRRKDAGAKGKAKPAPGRRATTGKPGSSASGSAGKGGAKAPRTRRSGKGSSPRGRKRS